MRIFIILLFIANLLFLGLNYFVTEPKRGASVSKKMNEGDGQSLVLLRELEKSELIADIVEMDAEKQGVSDRQFVPCLKIVGDWEQDGFNIIKKKLVSIDKLVISEGKERRKKVNYWVVIPPFDSKQEAIIAKRQLYSAKIVDTFIIKSGIRKNALSLGLYSKADGAKRRAKYVNDKSLGIADASIEALTLYVDRYWLKVASDKEDLDSIRSIIGKGIIDTKLEQCEIDR